jgi:hypothetical protein
MDNPLLLDLIRGAHLLCVVIGMGSAFYFDIRSVHRIAHPILQSDIDELHRIHKIVSTACFGLWLSGAALIWLRTNFDLAAFSPKLWSKIIVVTTLTMNAVILTTFVIPTLARYTGTRLVGLPFRSLLPMALCAGISFSCWLLALALGASAILKVAKWDVLLPILVGVPILSICGALAITFGARIVLYRTTQAAR